MRRKNRSYPIVTGFVIGSVVTLAIHYQAALVSPSLLTDRDSFRMLLLYGLPLGGFLGAIVGWSGALLWAWRPVCAKWVALVGSAVVLGLGSACLQRAEAPAYVVAHLHLALALAAASLLLPARRLRKWQRFRGLLAVGGIAAVVAALVGYFQVERWKRRLAVFGIAG